MSRITSFQQDFERIKDEFKQIRIKAQSLMSEYFPNKIKDGKCTLYSKDNVSFIHDLFECRSVDDFLVCLKPFTIHMTIPGTAYMGLVSDPKKNTTEEFPVTFEHVPKKLECAVECSDAYMATDKAQAHVKPQLKYIKELGYIINLAYKFAILNENLDALDDALEPLFEADRIIQDATRSEEETVSQEVDSKLAEFENRRAQVKEALKNLGKLTLNKKTSIERLLDHAFNEHTQGKIATRTWQLNILKVIESIDNEYYKSYWPMTELYWPRINFSAARNRSNLIQNNIQLLMDELTSRAILRKIEDLHQSKQHIGNSHDTVRSFMAPFEEELKDIADIRENLPRLKSDIDKLKRKQLENKRKIYLQTAIIAYNILQAILRRHSDDVELSQHQADINAMHKFLIHAQTLVSQPNLICFNQAKREVLKKLTQATLNLRDNSKLIPRPNWLDRLLAFIHKLFKFFPKQHEKVEYYNYVNQGLSFFHRLDKSIGAWIQREQRSEDTERSEPAAQLS